MTTTPFSHDIFEPKARSLFDAALDDRIVKCLLDLMQEKHEPTLEHSLGVSRIMSGIVTSTCVKDVVDNPVEFVRDGLLHDIGKFVVDKRTLNWPGRLGEREMAEIKATHLRVTESYEKPTRRSQEKLRQTLVLAYCFRTMHSQTCTRLKQISLKH